MTCHSTGSSSSQRCRPFSDPEHPSAEPPKSVRLPRGLESLRAYSRIVSSIQKRYGRPSVAGRGFCRQRRESVEVGSQTRSAASRVQPPAKTERRANTPAPRRRAGGSSRRASPGGSVASSARSRGPPTSRVSRCSIPLEQLLGRRGAGCVRRRARSRAGARRGGGRSRATSPLAVKVRLRARARASNSSTASLSGSGGAGDSARPRSGAARGSSRRCEERDPRRPGRQARGRSRGTPARGCRGRHEFACSPSPRRDRGGTCGRRRPDARAISGDDQRRRREREPAVRRPFHHPPPRPGDRASSIANRVFPAAAGADDRSSSRGIVDRATRVVASNSSCSRPRNRRRWTWAGRLLPGVRSGGNSGDPKLEQPCGSVEVLESVQYRDPQRLILEESRSRGRDDHLAAVGERGTRAPR